MRILIAAFILGVLLFAGSCKKCYNCKREKCYTCTKDSLSTEVCAHGIGPSYQLDYSLSTYRSQGYTCTLFTKYWETCETKKNAEYLCHHDACSCTPK